MTEALPRGKAVSRIDLVSINPSHGPRERTIRLHALPRMTLVCGEDGLHAVVTRLPRHEPRVPRGGAQR